MESDAITPEIQIDPHLTVQGDSTQLSQVFINLIQNAIDACNARPDIPPLIRISAEAGDDEVTVKISDNGEGIPDDIIDKIFDPFFTTKDVGSGMGLGLSICHAIIKSHAGRLDVQSEPSLGTVVAISLPTLPQSKNTGNKPANVMEPHESLIQL